MSSSLVSCVLEKTLFLLLTKARDKFANNLQQGDVADDVLVEMLEKKVDELSRKIGDDYRKDLLVSVSWLKEGVAELLKASSKARKKLKLNLVSACESPKTPPITCDLFSQLHFNDIVKLSKVVENLKVYSNNEYRYAIARFTDARKKSHTVFLNRSLTSADRVLAAQVRIVSELLECIETPEMAITSCQLFLEEFHREKFVSKIFSAFFKGGFKSHFRRKNRFNLVESVMVMHYIFFNYCQTFSSEMGQWLTWVSGIMLSDGRVFQPIIHWHEVVAKMSLDNYTLSQPRKYFSLKEAIHPVLSAVNARGEIVTKSVDESEDDEMSIIVISYEHDTKTVPLPEYKEMDSWEFPEKCRIRGLACDNIGNVYVICAHFICCDGPVKYRLVVLSPDFATALRERWLEFLDSEQGLFFRVALTYSKNIVFIHCDSLFLCNNDGVLQKKVKIDPGLLPCLSISHRNEIMISSSDGTEIDFYSEDGCFKWSTKLPAGHLLFSISFHYTLSKLLVVSWFRERKSFLLLTYNASGRLDSFTRVSRRNDFEGEHPCVASHPNGHVALIRANSILYI